MLVSKLLRIDNATVKEIKELAKKLSEKEYTSFSSLTRILIRKGLDMTKSNINSEQVKQLVSEAVEKALNECAFQHEANGRSYEGYDCKNLQENGLPTPTGLVQPTEEMLKYANSQPKLLKLKFEFQFEGLSDGKPGWIACQPVIDLSNIK